MATVTKKQSDVVLTDKAEKFFIVIKNGEKETRQEFKTEEEAIEFLPKVLELRNRSKGIRVTFRVQYPHDEHLYAPHERDLSFDSKGDEIRNPVTNKAIRTTIVMPQVKGKLYCPECGFHTKYKNDSYLGLKICTYCGISVNDFYVKSCNGLWETVSRKGK